MESLPFFGKLFKGNINTNEYFKFQTIVLFSMKQICHFFLAEKNFILSRYTNYSLKVLFRGEEGEVADLVRGLHTRNAQGR